MEAEGNLLELITMIQHQWKASMHFIISLPEINDIGVFFVS